MLNEQQLHQYGLRIGYPISSKREPSIDLLNDLIWQHVTHIPFEGLAPHLGENINITDVSALLEKLVINRRGGWCYEMNGLFLHVLETLGFDVHLQLASVYEAQQAKWLPASHAILMVNLDDQCFLVDVGFGNLGLTQAIVLSAYCGQMKNGIDYQLITSEEGYCFRAGFAHKITDQYRFTLTGSTLTLNDLAPLQFEMMTSYSSPFVRQRAVKIATAIGFKKLLGDVYTEYALQGGCLKQAHREQLTSIEEYTFYLRQHFHLALFPTPRLAWLPPVTACQSAQNTIERSEPQIPMMNTSVIDAHALIK